MDIGVVDATSGESTEVKGTDGAAHVRLIEKDTLEPAETAYFSWSLGDDSSTVTVTASGTTDSPPIDMRKIRRNEGTIHVIVTGSGTAKLTVLGSRDGITNLHSMGDRITGMVTATSSYILKLDDSNLAYFPFYTLRITETGGANSVTVKMYVAARGG